jgi:hypothetical protein
MLLHPLMKTHKQRRLWRDLMSSLCEHAYISEMLKKQFGARDVTAGSALEAYTSTRREMLFEHLELADPVLEQ